MKPYPTGSRGPYVYQTSETHTSGSLSNQPTSYLAANTSYYPYNVQQHFPSVQYQQSYVANTLYNSVQPTYSFHNALNYGMVNTSMQSMYRYPQSLSPYSQPLAGLMHNNFPHHQYNTASGAALQHYPQKPVGPTSATPLQSESQKIVLYCEPCDKEFTSQSAFEAHKSTHESCKHPGCSFSASKKVVIAHYHGSHGQFSGSGYKLIDVEGQKFRVLLGTSPEEVNQWRAERKSKFPTIAQTAQKAESLALLKESGGFITNDNSHSRKRPREVEGLETRNDPESFKKKICVLFSKGKCRHQEKCRYSHDFTPSICPFYLNGNCKRGNNCRNLHSHDNTVHSTSNISEPIADEGQVEIKKSSVSFSKTVEDLSKVDCDRRLESSSAPKENLAKRSNSSKSKLYVPPPLSGGKRGTLLKKLLESEVLKEENLLLQSIRYIVKSNFLQDQQ